jgi:hypothetical protein
MRWFNPDEYEHLHHAWMVMMGHLPHPDFFDNHTPGLWYLLAPLAWLLDERSTYLFASRFVMGVVTFAIFLVVYRLAATNRGYAGPLFSIFLLSVEPLFLSRTLEVRPDQVVILDRRLLEVAPWMKEFVRSNYAPSSVKGVYLRRGAGYRDTGAPGQ